VKRGEGLRDGRRWKRHRVAVPVGFENGTGTSCDISGTGICFETDQSFTPGAPIEFTMTFTHAFPEGPTQMCCHGTVVRVEQRRRKSRVAVAITYLMFPASTTDALKRAGAPGLEA
jgi:hypothetical protein